MPHIAGEVKDREESGSQRWTLASPEAIPGFYFMTSGGPSGEGDEIRLLLGKFQGRASLCHNQ